MMFGAWGNTDHDVTSAIIGPRTLKQLEDTLPCLDIAFSDTELARIDEIVPPGTSVL